MVKMEKEKHEYNRKNGLWGSQSRALAFVYDRRNIFSDYVRRAPLCQVGDVNIIEEYERYDDGTKIRRQWWWWIFYKTHYEIYKFTIRPSKKEKAKLLNEIITKSKRGDKNVK